MRKVKRVLTHAERSDRNLMIFTAGVVLVVFIVLYAIPSGLDEWNDHSQSHSQSLFAQIQSHF